MTTVSQETLNKLVAGGENVAKVVSGAATELTNEAINLFIIDGVLSILKFSVVFVIFFIVKKYLDAIADKDKDNKHFKAFKTTALVLSLIFFTTQSFPHIQVITKALVAPKIFLMEKTVGLAK